MEVLPRAGRELAVLVERDSQRETLQLTPKALGKYEMGDLGITPVYRPQFLNIAPGMPAAKAGLQHGDVVLAINGETGLTQEAVIARINQSAGKPLVLRIERDGQAREVTVTPEGPEGLGRIGVGINPWETRRIDPTLAQAVTMSLKQNWDSTVLIGKTLRGLFTRDTPVRQLMGPVAIAEMSGSAAQIGWLAIFNLMAMISLNLGLLNLVPVPVLDGGHIAILAIEGLARRDLSIRVKERMLMAGAALIVLLMVTVIFYDISRILR
jgi:regulator of sigma E protease